MTGRLVFATVLLVVICSLANAQKRNPHRLRRTQQDVYQIENVLRKEIPVGGEFGAEARSPPQQQNERELKSSKGGKSSKGKSGKSDKSSKVTKSSEKKMRATTLSMEMGDDFSMSFSM